MIIFTQLHMQLCNKAEQGILRFLNALLIAENLRFEKCYIKVSKSHN